MEVLMAIIGIAVIIFIRVIIVFLFQVIILGICRLLGAIFGIFTGGQADNPAPRTQPRSSPAPTPRPRTRAEPSPRVSGRVDELGVDSSWTKAEKRAHLVREFAKCNARMQILKDRWLREDCQRRMEKVTRAIMDLDGPRET